MSPNRERLQGKRANHKPPAKSAVKHAEREKARTKQDAATKHPSPLATEDLDRLVDRVTGGMARVEWSRRRRRRIKRLGLLLVVLLAATALGYLLIDSWEPQDWWQRVNQFPFAG